MQKNRIMYRIAELARHIEPDRDALWHWMTVTPIEELGGRTALELALDGQGERVVHLLEGIVGGQRD